MRKKNSTPSSRFNSAFGSLIFSATALPAAALSTLFSPTAYAQSALDRIIELHIPGATSLEQALLTWGERTGVTIMINSRTVERHITSGVNGKLTARDALLLILKDSGLTYAEDGSTIQVVPSAPSARTIALDLRLVPSAGHMSDEIPAASGSENPPAEVSSAGISNDDASHQHELQQIIVTAQKRSERLQDVPVPVAAVSAQALAETNQVGLEDYYATLPGVSVSASSNTGSPQVAIRGISGAAQQGPTVATTIDDVPIGSASALVFGWDMPDLDPSELQRIEVLRGPQGTLYGASSLGGLIKYVTIDPSTSGISGHVDVGTDTIQHASDEGYSLRAGVNVPLSDVLAMRVSGYERFEPGYIDNVETNETGVNREHRGGGRFALLFKPSETFSVKLSALLEHSFRYGSPFVDTVAPFTTTDPTVPANESFVNPTGDLQQSAVRGTGFLNKNLQAYSATVNAAFDGINLASITGYSISKNENSWDLSGALGSYLVYTPYAVSGDPDNSDLRDNKFTEELRLSGHLGDAFDWLVGGFVDHDVGYENQYLLAAQPTTGQSVGVFLHDLDPSTYQEEAGFLDLTYHFTSQFDFEAGGRYGDIRQAFQQFFYGPYNTLLGLPLSYVYPQIHSQENSFTYLLTPRFKITPELMVYARVATGYRPGGPNIDATPFGLPATYDHDSTKNYDLGLKATLLDHLLYVDASLYYIDWSGIQLTIQNPSGAGSAQTNGKSAKSEGVELTTSITPFKGFNAAFWVSFNNAVLTQSFPLSSTLFGQSGDRLPFSNRFSGSLSLNDDFPLASQTSGFVGGTVSYVGDRLGNFQLRDPADPTLPPQRQPYPSYAKVDLKTGAHYQAWSFTLYANNVTNRRAILNGGLDSSPTVAFLYIQPRTLGLSASRTF